MDLSQFKSPNTLMIQGCTSDAGKTVMVAGIGRVLQRRGIKVAPFKRAILYFNNIGPKDNIKLIYQDHLFGNGIIKFNFEETPLKL